MKGIVVAGMLGCVKPGSLPDRSASNDSTDLQPTFEAAELAESMLRRRVDALRARLAAEAIVLAAHASGDDPRILVLDRGMPWKNAVIAHELAVLFAVSSASDGNWMIDTVPSEPGSFAPRLALPEAWAGLQTAELAEQTGVADAAFGHLWRFVGAARSREGAVIIGATRDGDRAERSHCGSARDNEGLTGPLIIDHESQAV